MANPPVIQASVFQQALDEFSKTLAPEDQSQIQFTTLEDVQKCVLDIQDMHNKNGRVARNMTRLKPFLDAMEEYGKVIEVFLNASSILCFVWVRFGLIACKNLNKPLQGTAKFLLQVIPNTASVHATSIASDGSGYSELHRGI